ncbi:MAG: methionyl-tRNA synthetase [Miltoncostaeaceae bacterium]|jgi:methionyl-tRNA synthetase|nr:methionyl-tRNA synthetase [Miltoncostaeaceae bacterium]
MADGTFYVTTPIYYVNADPHIGHAYTTIMADILARHHRQRGEDVWYLTGTDEHGDKVARSAAALGRTPREHADALSARFRALGEHLGASNDFFIRTTDAGHVAVVQELVERMRASGDIYKGSYGGWYCTACEAFYAEDDLREGGLCPIHGTPVEWLEEENWFFRLSAYQGPLLALYEARPDFITPRHRLNEARSYVAGGLEDLSISRSQIDWGVQVPWDHEQVVYVWVDALINYYSALTYARPGEDLVARYWPADVHVMAKDILRFHGVIWPAMLMAAGIEVPRRLAVHGYVLKGGERMSKTTGNVVDPNPFIERYGIDALRYYLAREIRFGEDGTFTAEGFDQRYARELANELGNLINRVTSMVDRYRGGEVPADPGGDAALAAEVASTVDAVTAHIDALDLTRALEEAWSLVRRLNQLVEERAPWTLAKDPDRAGELDQVLASLAEGLRAAAILVWPYIPGSAERILERLGQPADEVSLARAAWGAGVPGARVSPGDPLFPRVEEEAA